MTKIRQLWVGGTFAALTLLAVALPQRVQAQAAGSSRVLGTVDSVNGNTVAVKTDAGATTDVTVPDTAKILRTAPGQKTLAGATRIAVSDIAAGDRVLMLVAGDPPAATVVIVNTKSDIAAMQAQEQADWARRGVGGLVKAVDAGAGTVTITSGTHTVTIHTTPSTVIRRYAPDSVKFSDAKPSTLGSIQPGDQVTARGNRQADDVTADEIVSGSFRNIAGVVQSTDASAGTFTVKDLVTKKTLTIKTTPDSDMRKLDPQMAQMIAMRLKGAAAGAGQGRGNSAAAGGNGQYRQAGGAGGAGGGGAGAMARVLERSPQIHVGDLHKGDAVMIVAASGNPEEATAIRLVAGVEPMLQASTSGSQNMFSSAWSLGGGSSGGEGDQGGGEGSPQ
ncbi:MAG TPA: hypothetical protein VHX37_05860 [Acidobacteriaceae bacterium]|jgi:hypothetical protein|nr:hypothetical protein [Acidobacteriaceae bacterium]